MREIATMSELEIDQTELYALTEEMLDRFPDERIASRVEEVREYAELHELYPEMDTYAEELVDAISGLARLAESQGGSVLADRLGELIEGFA
jgi:hypothetical protein